MVFSLVAVGYGAEEKEPNDKFFPEKYIIMDGNMYKIGHAIDVHKFASNRKLFLGGVEIPIL